MNLLSGAQLVGRKCSNRTRVLFLTLTERTISQRRLQGQSLNLLSGLCFKVSSWGLSYRKGWARKRPIAGHTWKTWPPMAPGWDGTAGNNHVCSHLSPHAFCEGGTASSHPSYLTSPCETECNWQGWNTKQFCWKIKLDFFLTLETMVKWKWIKDNYQNYNHRAGVSYLLLSNKLPPNILA